ncbi:MAG: hypothetical protein ACI8RD_006187 [Bacillariaceae sp.]|jgi:hypothetical protein
MYCVTTHAQSKQKSKLSIFAFMNSHSRRNDTYCTTNKTTTTAAAAAAAATNKQTNKQQWQM